MPCPEALRTQAYFDGEVDAIAAAAIEAHLATCAKCRAQMQDLQELRSALRQEVAFARAPPSLRARLVDALDRDSGAPYRGPAGVPDRVPDGVPDGVSDGQASRAARPPRIWRRHPFWSGAITGLGATTAAAAVVLLMLAPQLLNPLPDELVTAHVRSLMPQHLIDVLSTDKHAVKPWFAGNADVSPVVADFDGQGFRLIGGRADYFDHQRVAVTVYRHGSHVVNVFSWAARGHTPPRNTTRGGYHLAFWQVGDLAYCAVSDAGWDETLALSRLLQNAGAGDGRAP